MELNKEELQCEASKSAGYDPTGEWAVECGASGEYCPTCEMVLCAACHKSLAPDLHQERKKRPTGVPAIGEQNLPQRKFKQS